MLRCFFSTQFYNLYYKALINEVLTFLPSKLFNHQIVGADVQIYLLITLSTEL